MDGSRPPDIYDVARLAGVSHQTVSRVINNATNVRPATRDRVLEAIVALGYRRNRAARALVTRRSSTIGVMTSGSNLWGPSGALLGVERAAREAGYFVSLASLGMGDGEVADAMGHFRDQAVDGVIVIAPEAAMAHAADPLVAEVPVVMVAAGAEPSDRVMIISVDQELGARRATRHLVGLGHTRIGHVAGAAGWFDATARRRGWRTELESAGLTPSVLWPGDWTAESGYRAGVELRELLRSSPRTAPTAVFVANDLMALGLIRALHEGGLSVPGDVSVVGFDDIPGAAFFRPALTTVRQDFEELGRQSIALLLAALRHEERISAPIPPLLIARESTAGVADRLS